MAGAEPEQLTAVVFGAILMIGGIGGSHRRRRTRKDPHLRAVPAADFGTAPGGVQPRPILHRGSEFQVHADGSMSVRTDDSWEPLLENQYSTVTADGRTACTPAIRRAAAAKARSGSSSLTARRR
jgi:hypothetical protein